jgi:membrane protease YdiL (CAAX protease family)
MRDLWRRRAAAVLEVLGIYLAGPLAMYGLRKMLGISVTNPLNNLTAHATNAELVRYSLQLFVLLMFQYAGYFVLCVPVNWWHRRRGSADYGLTKNGRSWTTLLFVGLGAAALCEWPVVAVEVANAFHPGPTVPWRQAFMDMSWLRWQFWVFSAVASWALIPMVEELFYRGYCQRRLAEDWGGGPAVIGAACLFAFTHAQYLRADFYNLAMISTLLLSAVGFGIVFAWTRSIVPCIVAHALFDIPMTSAWERVLLVALLVGSAVVWRAALPIIGRVLSTGSSAACAALGIIGAVYAVLGSRASLIPYFVSVGMLILAIIRGDQRPRSRFGLHMILDCR